MALVQLIYSSTLVNHAPPVLTEILHAARNANYMRDITGMLLHSNGNVLQVLEGRAAWVNKTFAAIEADPRHRNVFVLARHAITERQFGAWTMGFRELTGLEIGAHPAAQHVFASSRREIDGRVKPGSALALLVFFAEVVDATADVH